jgi:hypothetical protein
VSGNRRKAGVGTSNGIKNPEVSMGPLTDRSGLSTSKPGIKARNFEGLKHLKSAGDEAMIATFQQKISSKIKD